MALEPNQYAEELIRIKHRMELLNELAEAFAKVDDGDSLALIGVLVKQHDREQEAIETLRQQRQAFVDRGDAALFN